MPLEKTFIRKAGVVVGSTTTGYSDDSTTVRDRKDNIVGHASEKFHTTRDSNGKLVSTNTSSPGLLIPKKN
jgi:hypothetical protein